MTAPGTLAIYAAPPFAEICRLLRRLGLDAARGERALAGPGASALHVFAWLLTAGAVRFRRACLCGLSAVSTLRASLGWLWIVEKQRPDAWDMTGACDLSAWRGNHPLLRPGQPEHQLHSVQPDVRLPNLEFTSCHAFLMSWIVRSFLAVLLAVSLFGATVMRYRPDLRRRSRQLPIRAAKAIALRTRHAASPAK